MIRFESYRPAPQGRLLPVDVVRKGDEVQVTVDLPGIDSSAIEVTVDRHVLTIAAERPAVVAAEGERVVTAERVSGRLVRRLTLGEAVDAGSISADVDRGVLTLHLPVLPTAQPRRISVNTPAPVEVTELAEAPAEA